jgi:hypothetical protein
MRGIGRVERRTNPVCTKKERPRRSKRCILCVWVGGIALGGVFLVVR